MTALRAWWLRLEEMRKHAGKVLAMNRRNLHYIYTRNQRKHFPLADDKLLAKEVLSAAGVRMPKTHRIYSYFYELRDLESDLGVLEDFVIKPAQGSGGNGIIVIVGRKGGDWVGISGKIYTAFDLRKHISDIIFGIYSFTMLTSRVGRRPAFVLAYLVGLAATVMTFGWLHQPADVFWMIPVLGFCNLSVFGG